jgi:hypothetical protein
MNSSLTNLLLAIYYLNAGMKFSSLLYYVLLILYYLKEFRVL